MAESSLSEPLFFLLLILLILLVKYLIDGCYMGLTRHFTRQGEIFGFMRTQPCPPEQNLNGSHLSTNAHWPPRSITPPPEFETALRLSKPVPPKCPSISYLTLDLETPGRSGYAEPGGIEDPPPSYKDYERMRMEQEQGGFSHHDLKSHPSMTPSSSTSTMLGSASPVSVEETILTQN